MIYQIANPVENTVVYVCPDQAKIDEGKTLGYQGIFVIGFEADAETLLTQTRQNWLNINAALFSVNKDIDPDPIQTTWIACDLANEPANTDVDYNVFNVLSGYYTLVTGLDNAKALLENTKQVTVDTFIPLESFEQWPKLTENTISMGIQTL